MRGSDWRWRCAGCDRRVSATAGTIFHGTRTPLTVWFSAAWLLVNSKTGISATQLRREMGLGSLQTAWTMLHRYRSVMVRPGRDRLRGDVEVDESFLGGPEPGVTGRGALGKVLFAAAVERDVKGFGRARLGVLPNASAVSLAAFLDANVEPGSRIITDGWSAYPAATRDRYEHTATSVAASGLQTHEVLPAVHRVFSLVKRWLMGTMQGSVSPEHIDRAAKEREHLRMRAQPRILPHIQARLHERIPAERQTRDEQIHLRDLSRCRINKLHRRPGPVDLDAAFGLVADPGRGASDHRVIAVEPAEPVITHRRLPAFLISHWGSHSIDLLCDLLGTRAVEVYCQADSVRSTFGVVDDFSMQLKFKSGARATSAMSFSSRHVVHDLVLIGTDATLSFDCYRSVALNGEIVFELPEGEMLSRGFEAQLADFVAAIGGAPSLASARSVLPGLAALDAAERSALRAGVVRL